MHDPSRRSPRRVDLSALWGAAAFLLLVGAVELFATFGTARRWLWRDEMFIVMSWWIGWLPLVPAIGAVVARFGFTRNRAPVSLLGHACAALVLSLAHLMIVTIVTWLVVGPSAPGDSWQSYYA